MYLKKLDLLGFKSFAEKTTLTFEPGITAVVGPNGCGKSNIFDSIRWVLGEQSVKSLRGSKMEDVIFNGTESIPALGYAEVSLTFTNEDKNLPIGYDEVTVTRRLFRSGESEYLINKTQVRLKDITDLFMGTGIGAESYSLIEQGKIDLILSSRPEDRRLVFDEAAGISKYKQQKKESSRKLEDTEANLLRLNDIITEVRRQINSLERQAAKAKRYKEVFDKLKEMESGLASFQITQFTNELNQLLTDKEKTQKLEEESAEIINQLNSGLNELQSQLLKEEAQLNTLRQQLNNAENVILKNIQQMSLNNERIQELNEKIKTIGFKKEELSNKVRQGEEKLKSFKAVLEAIINETEEKKGLHAKISSDLVEINKSIGLTQANIKEAKNKILSFAQAEAGMHNNIQQITNELAQTIARKKRLDIEKFKAEEELSSTKNKLENANNSLEAAFKKFCGHEEEVKQIKKLNDDTQAQKEILESTILSHSNELIALESQKEFLNSLKLRYENITEQTNAILLLDNLADTKTTGIIVKINLIQQADDKDKTLCGNIRFKASGTAKPISLDPQAIINKINELTETIRKIKIELAIKDSDLTALSLKLQGSQDLLKEIEIDYSSLKNQRDNIEVEYNKIKEESEIVLLESKDTDYELNTLKIKEKELNEKLTDLSLKTKENESSIELWLEDAANKNSQREKILINTAQLNAEIASQEEKLKNQKETYAMYEEALNADEIELKTLNDDQLLSAKRVNELILSNQSLETEKTAMAQNKGQFIQMIKASEKAVLDQKDAQAALQKKYAQARFLIDNTKDKLHKLNMRIQEITFSQSTIKERMQQVYKINTDEIMTYFKSELNIEELMQSIGLHKQKIESYGQVNLVAIEEFDELKQRYDFLAAQQEDLIKSKESLHEAILKINRTTKKMFLETFEKLALEFKNYFRMLFGGGDAQLFLTDEEDVLESGIEIVCRPPGKKLQNVLLLSGGEKAMSAISLLFAIFKVKPSPFCVLDEIDAALDEANVDRFGRALIDFTSQSQFIIITHNKKTIASADIMYGITMEKAGISKIVSVKLSKIDRENQPAGRMERAGIESSSQ